MRLIENASVEISFLSVHHFFRLRLWLFSIYNLKSSSSILYHSFPHILLLACLEPAPLYHLPLCAIPYSIKWSIQKQQVCPEISPRKSDFCLWSYYYLVPLPQPNNNSKKTRRLRCMERKWQEWYCDTWIMLLCITITSVFSFTFLSPCYRLVKPFLKLACSLLEVS